MKIKIFLIIAFLTSCAPTIKNFEKYQKKLLTYFKTLNQEIPKNGNFIESKELQVI